MITHEEVHDGNVFVRDGEPFFLDWAEACVSHPFVGLGADAARRDRARAASSPAPRASSACAISTSSRSPRFAPLPELRESYGHAYLLGTVCRALHVASDPRPAAGRPVAEELGNPIESWLEIFRGVKDGTITLGGA